MRAARRILARVVLVALAALFLLGLYAIFTEPEATRYSPAEYTPHPAMKCVTKSCLVRA